MSVISNPYVETVRKEYTDTYYRGVGKTGFHPLGPSSVTRPLLCKRPPARRLGIKSGAARSPIPSISKISLFTPAS